MGWLDNYGKEDNYNDSKVSLPKGFVGQGYDLSGRNYSPAWGGQFQMGGILSGAFSGLSNFFELTPSKSVKKEGVKSIYKENKPQHRELNIVDPRKTMATTNAPLRPNVDLLHGTYKTRHLDNLINEAKKQKMSKQDILNLSAMGFQETKWGRTDSNIGHVLDGKRSNPYSDFISAYKSKMQEADRLGITDPAMRLQVYNGLGKITPKTEKNYHGFEMQKAYGVPIPKEGISMKKNPLYGKQVLDIRDNVLGKNEEYIKYIDSIYNAPTYNIPKPLPRRMNILKSMDSDRFTVGKIGKIPFNKKMQIGGILPGTAGMMYSRTIDAAPSNGKYAKKTMASAQDGATIDYSELPYDLKNIKQFYNTMFDSSWYKERLGKNKYPNPEKVINTRKGYTNKTKFTEYENPDSDFDKILNIFRGKDDLTGSKHSKRDNRISFVKSQADEQFTFPRTIVTHEFSHPGDVAYPINNFESNELSKRLNLKGGIEIDEHDRRPIENKADINAIRYDLYKSGNFDPKTGKYKTPSGKFDKSMIQKINDIGGFDRLKTNYKTEDLIYLFNTIAQNQDNEFIPIAKNGVVKDDNGYWNPDNWGKVVEIDSNDITMRGVDQPLLGISDEGDVQYMEPGKDYKFKGKKVTEYPIAKNGINNLDQKSLQFIDQLTNFTNYNEPTNGGWLDKYEH